MVTKVERLDHEVDYASEQVDVHTGSWYNWLLITQSTKRRWETSWIRPNGDGPRAIQGTRWLVRLA